MSDKSPRKSISKKSGKSLKEKRADKKTAAAGKDNPTVLPIRRPTK